MAQTSNLKFLYHIVCMLLTVMLLDLMELKALLFFSSRDVADGYFGNVHTWPLFVLIQANSVERFTDDGKPMQNIFFYI